jgi:hypothetical protein
LNKEEPVEVEPGIQQYGNANNGYDDTNRCSTVDRPPHTPRIIERAIGISSVRA